MKERWLPVPGFEGIYSISDQGRVRRDRLGHGATGGRIRRLSPSLHGGYLCVTLHDRRRTQRAYVHLLVAHAFLGPCPEGQEVNHKDGIKANCTVTNLEYTTHAGNVQHGYDLGLYPKGEQRPNAKLTQQQADEIRTLQGQMRSEEVGAQYSISRQAVADIWAGRSWRVEHSAFPVAAGGAAS